jgi:hypothetical protein
VLWFHALWTLDNHSGDSKSKILPNNWLLFLNGHLDFVNQFME